MVYGVTTVLRIREMLVGEAMGSEIAPDTFDVVQFQRVFRRQPFPR